MNEMENEISETIDEFVFRAHTSAGGAWARACAFLLDLPPVLLGAWLLRLALGGLASAAGAQLAAWERAALWTVAFAASFWGWETAWGAGRFQATPGKLAHGLRVVTRDRGIRLDFARSSKRAFCKMIPAFWALVRAGALVLALHVAGAATAFSPGPAPVRWLWLAGIAFLAAAPSLPAWYAPAWRYHRQYAHDIRAGTLVRGPQKTPVRSVALQIAEGAAAAVLAMAAVHRFVADPPVPATFVLRGEAEASLKKQFARFFGKAPFRVAGVRARPAAGADGGSIGAIWFATNFEGTVRISRQRDSADLPIVAHSEYGEFSGALDETAGASASLDAFLVECTAPEPDAAAPEKKKKETASEAPRAVRPGGSATTPDGLLVRFLGAEAMPWPADEPARVAPWLLAADFVVENRTGEMRFAADWDASCSADGKPAKAVWLQSFDPLHAALPPGGKREGTLLFATPRRAWDATIQWLGIRFEASPEFEGD